MTDQSIKPITLAQAYGDIRGEELAARAAAGEQPATEWALQMALRALPRTDPRRLRFLQSQINHEMVDINKIWRGEL